MNKFKPFEEFIEPNEKKVDEAPYKTYEHVFFPLGKDEISDIDTLITIPLELKQFYQNIGYGFLFFREKIAVNRLLDPFSFMQINLRKDFYELDSDLDLYDDYRSKNLSIFFEINEGIYLLMNNETVNDTNSIFYFEEKIADSLTEFLLKYLDNPHYFE